MRICLFAAAAGGKFVSGAKVIAAVPSTSQSRTVHSELYEKVDRLETGLEAVVNNDGNTEFWKSAFLKWRR